MTWLYSAMGAIYLIGFMILWMLFDRSDFASKRDFLLARLTILLWPIALAFFILHDLVAALAVRLRRLGRSLRS